MSPLMTNTIQKATPSPGSASSSQRSSTRQEPRSPISRLPSNASSTGGMEPARFAVARSQSSDWMHYQPPRPASPARLDSFYGIYASAQGSMGKGSAAADSHRALRGLIRALLPFPPLIAQFGSIARMDGRHCAIARRRKRWVRDLGLLLFVVGVAQDALGEGFVKKGLGIVGGHLERGRNLGDQVDAGALVHGALSG